MGEPLWCTRCKESHEESAFGKDKSRSHRRGRASSCLKSRREWYAANYVPELGPRRRGPYPQCPRDGDKQQARQRINVEVRTGRRPHPNSFPCVDCNHTWSPGERRHEYDHHLGYSKDHHYDVEPVCTKCHYQRCIARGEISIRLRDERGRFAPLGGGV